MKINEELVFVSLALFAIVFLVLLFSLHLPRQIFIPLIIIIAVIGYGMFEFREKIQDNYKSVAAKILILSAVAFIFYRCVINPPVYFVGAQGVILKEDFGFNLKPIVDFYKLISEFFGAVILAGAIYWLLNKKDKPS